MAAPATHHPQPIVQGDTWAGFTALQVLVNGDPPASPLAAARLQFRRSAGDPAKATLTSEVGGGITFVSAVEWRLQVEQQILPLCAGDWHWDLELTDISGKRKTYVAGVLKILPDITRSAA